MLGTGDHIVKTNMAYVLSYADSRLFFLKDMKVGGGLGRGRGSARRRRETREDNGGVDMIKVLYIQV
jgi:hypothetical protein